MSIDKSLKNIKAVFKRELVGYFGSPLAYVVMVIFLIMLGFLTFNVSHFYEIGQANLRPFFEWHPWVFLFLIPAVTMRLWAEEWRLGTLELIMTLPIRAGEAILGKFLAAWAFIGISLLFTLPMVFTVLYLGNPDMGTIICAYIGSFLMAGAFLSIGLFTSSLTRSQVVGFIIGVTICFFFILVGYPPVTRLLMGWAPMWAIDAAMNLSFLTHYQAIQRGVLDIRDFVYFLSIMAFMLFANGVVLHNRRTS